MMNTIKLLDKGVIAYSEAWQLQREIFDAVSGSEYQGDDVLMFCEHPHVYTLGRSGKENNLLVDERFLEKIGATFYKIDRGGDITYHGYGQLVGYPILRLLSYNLSLKGYIETLERAVIDTVAHYGIESFCVDGKIGVWVESDNMQKKICAIGVKASRYVTMHGFALNVNTNLDYFKYINPCGFTDGGVTSLKELLGREVDFEDVKKVFYNNFLTSIGAI